MKGAVGDEREKQRNAVHPQLFLDTLIELI